MQVTTTLVLPSRTWRLPLHTTSTPVAKCPHRQCMMVRHSAGTLWLSPHTDDCACVFVRSARVVPCVTAHSVRPLGTCASTAATHSQSPRVLLHRPRPAATCTVNPHPTLWRVRPAHSYAVPPQSIQAYGCGALAALCHAVEASSNGNSAGAAANVTASMKQLDLLFAVRCVSVAQPGHVCAGHS